MNLNPTASPASDVLALFDDLPAGDAAAVAATRARDGELTKPPGSLGRLEEIVEWLAAWQGRHPPAIDNPVACVFAGNHGVAAQGVSAFPAEVTAQMVANFRHGGAAINQLCAASGIALKVFEMALETPTRDFSRQPAMSRDECARAMIFGMQAIAGECDLLCLGEMGIANTTAAAALAHALYGGRAVDWTGPGTGLDADGVSRKARIVADAVAAHKPACADPLDVLACFGGREIAAMAGAILAARLQRVPVLIDGYVATAAACIVHAIDERALDHCLAAHVSAEPAHARMLERIGKRALLDLDMRLGEASGAALAVAIVRAALAIHTGMATFAEAGVAEKS